MSLLEDIVCVCVCMCVRFKCSLSVVCLNVMRMCVCSVCAYVCVVECLSDIMCCQRKSVQLVAISY